MSIISLNQLAAHSRLHPQSDGERPGDARQCSQQLELSSAAVDRVEKRVHVVHVRQGYELSHLMDGKAH